MTLTMEEAAAVVATTAIRAHLSTISISSSNIMEDLPLLVEVIIMGDPHNPLLEATQVSSSTSSTMLICNSNSSNRPCTTTPSMLCRCSSTTPAWASSTLGVLLLLHQCTRGGHLGRSSRQSETMI